MVAWTPAVMCAGWALVRVLGLDAGYPAVPLVTAAERMGDGLRPT